jgi:hypothetical protein
MIVTPNHTSHRLTTILTTLTYTKQCGPLDAFSHYLFPVHTDPDTVHTHLPCFCVTINCVTLLLPCKKNFPQLCFDAPLVLTQLFLLFTLSKFDAYNVYVVVTTLLDTLVAQLCHTLALWLWRWRHYIPIPLPPNLKHVKRCKNTIWK